MSIYLYKGPSYMSTTIITIQGLVGVQHKIFVQQESRFCEFCVELPVITSIVSQLTFLIPSPKRKVPNGGAEWGSLSGARIAFAHRAKALPEPPSMIIQ